MIRRWSSHRRKQLRCVCAVNERGMLISFHRRRCHNLTLTPFFVHGRRPTRSQSQWEVFSKFGSALSTSLCSSTMPFGWNLDLEWLLSMISWWIKAFMSNKNLTNLIFDISYHISSSYLPASAMIWPSNPAIKMIFGMGHSSAWEYGDGGCTSTMVGATFDD